MNKNTTASILAISLLLVGTLGVTAAPTRLGATQVAASSPSSRSQGPFSATSKLTVYGIGLGMTHDEVHRNLRLPTIGGDEVGFDLKFDRSAHVCFVAGAYLKNNGQDVGSSFDPTVTISKLGRPWMEGTAKGYNVAVYRAGSDLVMLRYEPGQLDRRSGIIGQYAISTDNAWVPYDWGHAMLQSAGL